MDDLSYQPPLRGALLRLMREALPFGDKTLAEQAGAAVERAKAYASILINAKVLRRDEGGNYRQGSKWKEWSTRACRTRPIKGGHNNIAAMDAMRRPLSANVKRLREAREWSSYRLSQEAGVDLTVIRRLEERCVPPSLPAVVMIARALAVTVEDLVVSNCLVPAQR